MSYIFSMCRSYSGTMMGTLKKKKTFLFCVGVYNVVLVSDGQQRDSAITYNISILPQTPLPLRIIIGTFDW